MRKVSSISKAIIAGVAALGLNVVPTFGQSDSLKQAVNDAFSYTEVQRFNDALSVLSQVSDTDKDHYLYGLTRARILTWSQNYPAAQNTFTKLIADHPDNPDILVPYAYLQLFDGQLDTAEFYFSKVLRNYPDYDDAIIGLQRTQDLKRERRSIF